MKKSEAYHLAQIAVVNSMNISPENKVKVMRVLMYQESLEQFCEEQEEAKCDTSTTA